MKKTLSVPEKCVIQYVGDDHLTRWTARALELGYRIVRTKLPDVPFEFDVAYTTNGTIPQGSCCAALIQFGWLKEPV